MLPFAVADVYLADGEDEVVDAVAELGGQAEEGRGGAVELVAGMGSVFEVVGDRNEMEHVQR
jgi:hypothetical protein